MHVGKARRQSALDQSDASRLKQKRAFAARFYLTQLHIAPERRHVLILSPAAWGMPRLPREARSWPVAVGNHHKCHTWTPHYDVAFPVFQYCGHKKSTSVLSNRCAQSVSKKDSSFGRVLSYTLRRRRLKSASPIRPPPSRRYVAGSGTTSIVT